MGGNNYTYFHFFPSLHFSDISSFIRAPLLASVSDHSFSVISEHFAFENLHKIQYMRGLNLQPQYHTLLLGILKVKLYAVHSVPNFDYF